MKSQGKMVTAYLLMGAGIGIFLSGLYFQFNPNIKLRDYTETELNAIKEQVKLEMTREELEVSRKLEKEKEENKVEETSEEKELAKENSSEEVKTDGEEEIINFEIKKGESSQSVAERLKKEGVIKDATEFNKTVAKMKVQKKILYGSFELKKNMTDEEVIEILTLVY